MSKKDTDVDDVIKDSKKCVEVTLPDVEETVTLGKIKYAQMKEAARATDNWDRNDISMLAALKNGGSARTQEWLDELTTDDITTLSSAFAELTGGATISPEDWLMEKHPDILAEYRKDVEATMTETGRPGSNPLRGTSTRARASPSFG